MEQIVAPGPGAYFALIKVEVQLVGVLGLPHVSPPLSGDDAVHAEGAARGAQGCMQVDNGCLHGVLGRGILRTSQKIMGMERCSTHYWVGVPMPHVHGNAVIFVCVSHPVQRCAPSERNRMQNCSLGRDSRFLSKILKWQTSLARRP